MADMEFRLRQYYQTRSPHEEAEEVAWVNEMASLGVLPARDVQVRWYGNSIDEVVADNATIHLERMSSRLWSLSVTQGRRRWLFNIYAPWSFRPRVEVRLVEGPED